MTLKVHIVMDINMLVTLQVHLVDCIVYSNTKYSVNSNNNIEQCVSSTAPVVTVQWDTCQGEPMLWSVSLLTSGFFQITSSLYDNHKGGTQVQN